MSNKEQQTIAEGRAAFYGLYLREVEGLAPDEAAALVMERYPQTGRPRHLSIDADSR